MNLQLFSMKSRQKYLLPPEQKEVYANWLYGSENKNANTQKFRGGTRMCAPANCLESWGSKGENRWEWGRPRKGRSAISALWPARRRRCWSIATCVCGAYIYEEGKRKEYGIVTNTKLSVIDLGGSSLEAKKKQQNKKNSNFEFTHEHISHLKKLNQN